MHGELPREAERRSPRRRRGESKVSVMQTGLSSVAEKVNGLRASGPRRVYASVIHASLCTLLLPLGAMNGFCGVRGIPRIGLAVAGAPWKAGSEVGVPPGVIGVAAPAVVASEPASASAPAVVAARRAREDGMGGVPP